MDPLILFRVRGFLFQSINEGLRTEGALKRDPVFNVLRPKHVEGLLGEVLRCKRDEH